MIAHILLRSKSNNYREVLPGAASALTRFPMQLMTNSITKYTPAFENDHGSKFLKSFNHHNFFDYVNFIPNVSASRLQQSRSHF